MSAEMLDGNGSKVAVNIENNEGLLLYYHNYSYYSQKVLMALYEKNLPFESHTINLATGAQYDPWYLKVNPRGEVPVLQDNGTVIPDSMRIIDYLEENYSNENIPRLIPIDQGEEIKQKVINFRQIMDHLPVRSLTMGSFFHSEFVRCPKPPFIGPARSRLANSEKNIGETLKKLAEENPEAREVLLQKATVHEHKNTVFTDRDEYIAVLAQFDDILSKVENELANHGDGTQNWWLCSDRFTIADIALTVLLERLSQLGFASRFWTGGKRPNVEKYYARVKERNSYRKTMPTAAFHVKMFLTTYKTPLIFGIISVSFVAAVAIIIGGIYLSRK